MTVWTWYVNSRPDPIERVRKVVRMIRSQAGLGAIHGTAFDEAGETVLEGERPMLPRDRDLLMKLVELIAPDVLTRAVADDEELRGRDTSTTHTRQKRLDKDGRQGSRNLLADGRLPLRRE